MSHSVPTALGSPLLASETLSLVLVPVEDQHGLGTVSGSAATSTATTVILSLHTTPKKWLEE